MIIYTLKDYLKVQQYIFKQAYFGLNDNEEEYKIIKSRKSILIKNNQHHKNDKLFRNILNNKREIIKIVNKYLDPKEEITEEMIEKYDTKFLTNTYDEKEADIVFKLKNKEIFFLIEHQTKINRLMAYRILEYSLEIIRTRIKNIKGRIEKIGLPRVIPMVIYTGQAKWTAKDKLEEIQVEFEHLKGIDIITGYNLIDIRDKKEAIKQKSAVARMSVIERMNNTEEIMRVIREIAKNINEKDEKNEFAKEVRYLLETRLSDEKLNEIDKILKEKEGEEGMLHAQMVLKRDAERIKRQAIREGLEEGREKGMKEGMKEGIKKGIKEGVKEGEIKKAVDIAKKMLNEKLDIEFICKITGLQKEQFVD